MDFKDFYLWLKNPWVYGPTLFLVYLLLMFLIKKIGYGIVERFATKTKAKIDDIILAALNLPLNFIIVSSAVLILERILPLTEAMDKVFFFVFQAFLIIAVIFFIDHLARDLMRVYAPKYDFLVSSKGIIQGLIRAVIIGLGILILLDAIGISITPLLASLGIGSLAVALALQDTLNNFFSGLHILMDKPIKIGQFIKLESGEEGYVENIGWRTTRVRMLPNNIVVVPNAKLVNSVITNYYYPSQDLAVLVQVGVSYNANLKHVEKVTCEVGKHIMKTVTGGVPEFDPFIRYHTFSDFSINFTVILRAKEFVDNYLIKHEFIKALHERYNKEGIVIPFPIRTLDMKKEDLTLLASK
ncbi:MAG: mechanosensitive ion channel [Elusimicrobia bacterium]|nr:mechanosensitive ion channel [Elusimicrobiota bacterium]MBD3412006.1 mechanosensitive ion channel [Elusimicrobiota bacterium]